MLDIDHTPTHVLHPDHARFYTADGLARLTGRLHHGGVFGLWSDTLTTTSSPPPGQCSLSAMPTRCGFPNHHTGGDGANTVYIATVAT